MPYLKINPSIHRENLSGLHPKPLLDGGLIILLDPLKMQVIFCSLALYLKLLRFVLSAFLSESCLWLINFTVDISWNFTQQQDMSLCLKSSI